MRLRRELSRDGRYAARCGLALRSLPAPEQPEPRSAARRGLRRQRAGKNAARAPSARRRRSRASRTRRASATNQAPSSSAAASRRSIGQRAAIGVAIRGQHRQTDRRIIQRLDRRLAAVETRVGERRDADVPVLLGDPVDEAGIRRVACTGMPTRFTQAGRSPRLLTPSRSTATCSPNTALIRASARLDDGEVGIVRRGAHEQDAHRPCRGGGGAAEPSTAVHRGHSPRRAHRRAGRASAAASAWVETQTASAPRTMRDTSRARGRSSAASGWSRGMCAKIVVEVVQQRHAVIAAVADQGVGSFQVGTA